MNEMLTRICVRNFCSCSPLPWLFVGLGNPGDKYKGTRHNVGFEMLDAFAESEGIHMDTVHCKAMFGKGYVNGVPVLLAKPLTYMNLSGESIGPLAAYYKLPLNRVLVFHDDMDLPCGVLRLHPKGSHHSNSGLKSLIYHFHGNREFPRLRIGIGRPPGQMDPKAFLLQKFNAIASERIDAALPEGIDGLKQVLSTDVLQRPTPRKTISMLFNSPKDLESYTERWIEQKDCRFQMVLAALDFGTAADPPVEPAVVVTSA